MSTIVERPLGALPSHPNLTRQSRSNSIEIIDVDTFEDLPSTSQSRRPAPRPRSRPQPSHPETIFIDSDDDEIEFVASRVRAGHDVDRNHSHRHFISPAPRDVSAPPPVPPVPRRFAGQTSFPVQSHPPVIPSAEPLPFERTSVPPVAGPSNLNVRAVPRRGVAPSHFQPAMGLGGALISSNRTHAQQRQREADLASTTIRRGRRGAPITLSYRSPRDFLDPFSITDRDDDFYIHMLLNPLMGTDAEHAPSRWSLNYLRRSEPTDEQYRPSYTHASLPEPGFTFDFAAPSLDEENASKRPFFPPTSKEEPIILDDDDEQPTACPSTSASNRESSAGSGQLNALLVCAKCLDPLVLNAALSPDEAELKRIWALRCGHLIDEKCLNILGQPPVEEAIPDKKGKGKATMHRCGYGVGTPDNQPQQEQTDAVVAPEETSIRSRLRSRRSATGAGDAAAHGPSVAPSGTAQEAAPQVPSSTMKKRRVTHRKPRIEAEFEWACPVASCERVHVSVRINGVWGPEKEPPTASRGAGKAGIRTAAPRGAIAVFA